MQHHKPLQLIIATSRPSTTSLRLLCRRQRFRVTVCVFHLSVSIDLSFPPWMFAGVRCLYGLGDACSASYVFGWVLGLAILIFFCGPTTSKSATLNHLMDSLCNSNRRITSK
uniref:Uncharacterized protein n=1 Tax=Arundo donax TaxID=35708 RepID=A0A0A9F186_ARUDO